MIFVTGLLVYHIKLVCRNRTTREDLKGFFNNAFANPYSRNVSRNISLSCCAKVWKPSVLKKMRINHELREKALREKKAEYDEVKVVQTEENTDKRITHTEMTYRNVLMTQENKTNENNIVQQGDAKGVKSNGGINNFQRQESVETSHNRNNGVKKYGSDKAIAFVENENNVSNDVRSAISKHSFNSKATKKEEFKHTTHLQAQRLNKSEIHRIPQIIRESEQ